MTIKWKLIAPPIRNWLTPVGKQRKRTSNPKSRNESAALMNKHSNLSVTEDTGGNRSITGKFFQGAIPSPDSMKEYQEVDPSIPLRLIQWTEDESKHRRKIENKFANQSFATILIGYITGLIALCLIAFLAYLFMKDGHAVEGKWIALSMAGVISIFVIRRAVSTNKKEQDTSL